MTLVKVLAAIAVALFLIGTCIDPEEPSLKDRDSLFSIPPSYTKWNHAGTLASHSLDVELSVSASRSRSPEARTYSAHSSLDPPRSAQVTNTGATLPIALGAGTPRKDLVTFGFDQKDRLIGLIRQPIDTTDDEELILYIAAAADPPPGARYAPQGTDRSERTG